MASGGKDKSTSRRASSLAMIRVPGLCDRMAISKVRAPTFSPLAFNTMRLCFQCVAHISMATSTARHPHTCWPSAVPVGTPNILVSSSEIGQAKRCTNLPSIVSQPPIPHGDASVPISTIVPVRRYAPKLKNRSMFVFPKKNADSHCNDEVICLVHMQLCGHPLESP